MLAKELGCLGELLGREFEGSVKIWKWNIPFKFKQKPISIPTFITLMDEFKTYKEMEAKANKIKKRR